MRRIIWWLLLSFLFLNYANAEQIGDNNRNKEFESINGSLYNNNILIKYDSPQKESNFYLPDGTIGIDNQAFSGYKNPFDVLHIPSTCIDIQLTGDTIGIKDFQVAENNPLFSARDGILFSKDGTELIMYPSGRHENTVIIPEGTKKIGEWAFSGIDFDSIVFPSSLEWIGMNAFSGCYNLTSIHFPEGLWGIDAYAFEGCRNLNAIEFPDTLQWIGIGAFSECTSLQYIQLPCQLRVLGSDSFWASPIREIKLPSSLQHIGVDICIWGNENNVPESAVFCVDVGSYAHRWAVKSGLPYILIYNEP